MLSLLQRLSDGLNRVAELALAAIMAALVVVVFAQVFFRYIVHSSLPWSEEVARYMLIWVSFLGSSIGVKRWAHFGVDAVAAFLPPAARRILDIALYLMVMAVCLVLIYFGWQNLVVVSTQRSVAVSLPMQYVYGAIPLSAVLMLLHTLVHLLRTLNNERVERGGLPMVDVERGALE